MAREPSTRDGHWRNWRSVVTWAIAHGVVLQILPIRLDVLQALSWQLLALRCSPAHLQSIWAAIAQRHREAGLHTPLDAPGEYSRWLHACSVTVGRPRLLKFPVQRNILVRLWSNGISGKPLTSRNATPLLPSLPPSAAAAVRRWPPFKLAIYSSISMYSAEPDNIMVPWQSRFANGKTTRSARACSLALVDHVHRAPRTTWSHGCMTTYIASASPDHPPAPGGSVIVNAAKSAPQSSV